MTSKAIQRDLDRLDEEIARSRRMAAFHEGDDDYLAEAYERDADDLQAVRDAVADIEADAFEIAKKNGMTVYRPNASEVDMWRTASQPVIEKWLGASGPLAKQVYDAALSLRM